MQPQTRPRSSLSPPGLIVFKSGHAQTVGALGQPVAPLVQSKASVSLWIEGGFRSILGTDQALEGLESVGVE